MYRCLLFVDLQFKECKLCRVSNKGHCLFSTLNVCLKIGTEMFYTCTFPEMNHNWCIMGNHNLDPSQRQQSIMMV